MALIRPVNDLEHNLSRCVDNCVECHKVCLETFSYSLATGGRHSEADHVRLLLDCAEMCQTTANFMLRHSAAYGALCEACAAVCQACADDCTAMSASNEQMRACAQICRRCAESCRAINRA